MSLLFNHNLQMDGFKKLSGHPGGAVSRGDDPDPVSRGHFHIRFLDHHNGGACVFCHNNFKAGLPGDAFFRRSPGSSSGQSTDHGCHCAA
jgi:hypothetical protein